MMPLERQTAAVWRRRRITCGCTLDDAPEPGVEEADMVRMVGKALVASWRPYESGGGSQMRSSQMESDSVTVLDQVVLAQHPDGFWETFPLANCSIIWTGKPTITLIEDGRETELPITGRENTLADQMAQ